MISQKYPILYSFRRCPFAMRARFILRSKSKLVELREIKLQSKPKELISISNKATVPVLKISEKEILEESLDIIRKYLCKLDLYKLGDYENEVWKLIQTLDKEFKINLDKYKYSSRYENCDSLFYRDKNIPYLKIINNALENNKFLFSNKITFIDYCIFPFVRQYRNVNIEWFENLGLIHLNNWFLSISNSYEFKDIMKKYKVWSPNDKPIVTNFRYND